MASSRARVRLSIEVEPELRRRIKVVAARKDVTVRDFIQRALERALEEDEKAQIEDERRAWSRLSAPAFARDWECEGDEAYDRLA